MSSKAYRFLNKEIPSPHIVVESINVEVFDNTFPFQKSQKIVGIREPESSNKRKPKSFKQVKPRKSSKEKKRKDFYPDYVVCLEEGDPLSYNEAMSSHDVVFWKEAIDDEMHSIITNQTWVLVDLPQNCKPIGCKWVFRRKLRPNGIIKKFKAGLVAKGCGEKDFDYFDTYAPVTRISAIRLLIAMVAINNLIIYQMDVKTAFLNGQLEEEIYMKQPKGFVVPG